MKGNETMTATGNRVSISDRLGAGCGAAYVLLIVAGNQLAFGSSQDPHPSGARDLADFAAPATTGQVVGQTLELTGFLVFTFFLGWLAHQLRRRGGAGAWLGGTAALAGGITLAVKIASILPVGAAILDHAELTPSAARVLADMNAVAFVVTFLPFSAFLIAAGTGLMASRATGRAAGYIGVVIGVLLLAVTLIGKGSPVDTNPMPFLIGLLWLLVISIRLAWKGPRVATAGVDPAVAAAVASA